MSVADGVASPSVPLEAGVRDQLSTAFGHDLSGVRVHAGPEAARSAAALGAQAYTVGQDVVFGQGRYDPLGSTGRALIAHEAAHVVQHAGTGGGRFAPSFLLTDPGAAVPAADARLERQAHRAAALRDAGLPGGWSWERPSRPFLGMVGEGETPVRAEPLPAQIGMDGTTPATAGPAPVAPAGRSLPAPAAPTTGPAVAANAVTLTPAEADTAPRGGSGRITSLFFSPDDDQVARAVLDRFDLPASKGPWRERYDALAQAHQLHATLEIGGRNPTGLMQQRAPTDELWRRWRDGLGWPGGARGDQWWIDVGGNPSRTAVNVDHIVELQFGGTNVPENLVPHDAGANQASGRDIRTILASTATAVIAVIPEARRGRVRSLTLSYSAVNQAGSYPVTPLPTLTAGPPTIEEQVVARRGRAINSVSAAQTALNDRAAGIRPSAAERGAALASLEDYPIVAGPSSATLKVPPRPTAVDVLEDAPLDVNRNASELIAGLVLENVDRRHRPATAVAWLNSDRHPVRTGTRLPLLIRPSGAGSRDAATGPGKALHFTVGAGGALRLAPGDSRLAFTYPYLSAGTMTLQLGPDGLVGHGTITPSVPLLSRVPITVDLDRTGLRGSVSAPPERLSFPPFRVTESSIVVNLAPELSVTGAVGFAIGSVVTGRIQAGLDANGFLAQGDITATIPGLDTATGHVEYRPATGLSGFVVARASRAAGVVRSGEVRLDFANNAWRASGQVDLMLGTNPATLSVRTERDRVVYGGRARVDVPGLHPVDVTLTYDGQHLTGTAHTTFTLLGANGDIALTYRDGRFSGTGSVHLQRGRFAGDLQATLDEHGGITGRGTGRVEIRPGLVGTVGIEYGRDHRVRVSGELRFPPYRFLEPRRNRYQLFQRSLPDIPIFAIPLGIGSVGIVARIGGGLAAQYSFGPGEIRDMVVRGAFDPLEDDMNAELSAEARLVLPAEAGLELSVRAGLGASVAIASVTGGITATGGVLLRGGLDASARLAYARGVLTFDTSARISVQPVLTLRLEADVMIEAAVGGPWRWPYELANYSYATGLEFGLVAPFHYQSDQPLRLPEAADIQWIVPQIDVGALVDRVSQRVRAAIDV